MTLVAPRLLTWSILVVLPSGMRLDEAVVAMVPAFSPASPAASLSARAICSAQAPVADAPPSTSSLSPARRSPSGPPSTMDTPPEPVRSAWYAVSPTSGSPAASLRPTPAPANGATHDAGSTAYSAMAPQLPAAGGGSLHVSARPVLPITSAPTPSSGSSTPAPTASTTPDRSKPSVAGKDTGAAACRPPVSSFQSMGLTAAYDTLTRTSPAAGAGTGRRSSDTAVPALSAAATSPPGAYAPARHARIWAAMLTAGRGISWGLRAGGGSD
mmetsp:Transcript_1288/g.5166  ORF Transcript_1288/g.5166 Transcript_1288/m.5166 type:complete len:270 (+) Transcript_1288:1515-2324(+)